MIRVELEIMIKRPVGEVFDRLTDLPGYNDWMSRSGLFVESRKTSEDPVGEGTTFTDKIISGGLAIGRISEYKPPTRVKFRQTVHYFGFTLMESRPEYSLESLKGHTRVRHFAEGNMFGMFKIFEPVFKVIARAERKRTVYALKRSLESSTK